MWIFTNKGFVSAVQHRNQPAHLMVRARDRVALEQLVPESQIERTERADYLYRTTVSKVDFMKFMNDAVSSIEYDNFKNSIVDSDYHDACSSVWGVMHDYQLQKEHH